MAIPASEQWTALFLPQLLFAADPERLYSGGPAPRALLIEDRIAARNREAVRLGVRRCMNAKEALLQTPALQLERSGQLVGQELSSILLSIAQSFGAIGRCGPLFPAQPPSLCMPIRVLCSSCLTRFSV